MIFKRIGQLLSELGFLGFLGFSQMVEGLARAEDPWKSEPFEEPVPTPAKPVEEKNVDPSRCVEHTLRRVG